MSVTIYGQVTDFNGVLITGSNVEIKDKRFNDLYSTLSDENGY